MLDQIIVGQALTRIAFPICNNFRIERNYLGLFAACCSTATNLFALYLIAWFTQNRTLMPVNSSATPIHPLKRLVEVA
jgi:hypothetical protein